MENVFRVSDLKKMVEELIKDKIEFVEINLFERDEISGELIGASLEFNGCTDDQEGIDYGGIEEVIIEE